MVFQGNLLPSIQCNTCSKIFFMYKWSSKKNGVYTNTATNILNHAKCKILSDNQPNMKTYCPQKLTPKLRAEYCDLYTDIISELQDYWLLPPRLCTAATCASFSRCCSEEFFKERGINAVRLSAKKIPRSSFPVLIGWFDNYTILPYNFFEKTFFVQLKLILENIVVASKF